jgi:DinB superfamily
MTPSEIAELLESGGRSFAGTLRSLPQEAASWHPAKGEWCVNECAGHVIEADKRGFAGRIRIILGESDPDLPGWDRASVSHARNDCARRPEDIASELEGQRADGVALVRSLTPEQLTRGGNHADVGRLTVNDLLHEWAYHDANHLRQALANVQAYVWGAMGNAQRFTTG